MRALITGAGGFVGPHLAAHLVERGDEVIGLDTSDGPDLTDPAGWVDALGRHRPEVVYHLAGWSDVSGSWQAPLQTFTVNATGTMAVLEAAVAAGVGRVVYISSADVYGIVAVDDQPITEHQPCCPRSPYGVSKQAAEAVCHQYVRGRGLDVVIVRPFNHLGPGQSPRFVASAFASQIAEAELAGGGELRHGDLSARRDLSDVADVVRAYRLLAERGRTGEVYNVCSGEAVTMQSLLDILVERAKVPIATSIDPERLRPVELPLLVGSHAKLTADTGWEPSRPLADTLAAVLDDARERGI
ncbi:MAG: GDP-mannose 4,6-dehydratase [Acidimicrobiales bacterium]